MKTIQDIPESVVKAYNKYQQAEENTSISDYDDKADKKARRYYNAFTKACQNAGLNHIEVINLFIPTTLSIKS